jgi:hypothetical protein
MTKLSNFLVFECIQTCSQHTVCHHDDVLEKNMSDDDSFDPFEFDHVIDPFGMTENDFFDASDDVLEYGNTGCRVFEQGVQN